MARFKQPADGQRQNPGTQPRRPAAHARHAAPARRPQAHGEPASRAEASPRGSRFADASRATASSHRFPKLGNTSTRLADGQVPAPVSTSSPDDAPRPIGVDPSVTGSFHTIRDGQGAVVATRETASAAADAAREAMGSSKTVRASARRRRAAKPAPAKAPKGVLVGMVVAVVVVIALATFAVRSLVEPAASGDDAATAAAQTSVEASGGVSVAGSSYSTRQGDAGWELVKGEGDDAAVVAQLSGTPVALCLHEGTLFVPENLSDGTWDVICYVVADGSTPTQLLNNDGQPVVGSGELSRAELDGNELVVTDTSGVQTRISLL
ncbi:hypothetical protein [Parolsenella catena]|uniref:hypothetical protein n=1 Tax=Parolsenella catena TaxID=2003188 RepID=UPI002FDEE146